MIGKRVPWRTDYTIGFDNYGKLLGQKMILYVDCGNNTNDSLDLYFSKAFVDNA